MPRTCFDSFETTRATFSCVVSTIERAATGRMVSGDAATLVLAVLLPGALIIFLWSLIQRTLKV